MSDDPEREEPRTVFQPRKAPEPPPAAAEAGTGRVEVGVVLNHIFKVTRFIARGGMGEVFEGVNVNTDERVAIKVMLPALAADPAVQAMFRKEARTLTRLSHPALVQYRVLAQEPQLGVFYIVTEFIEGQPLSDMLGSLHPSSEQLRGLMRCLCEGLRAAHQLGAIHRDISPDNVLLEHNKLDKAKIIDFGIAKDLDASTGTIVGDGFAGKLAFVAPEQFGDFGREVGPWTDVYSLALVILSVAQGRNVDMGATLVDAVDRRRAGPDLSAAPPDLQPVLARMLVADPAKRARSMDEVLDLLNHGGEGRTVFAEATPEAAAGAGRKPASRSLMIGGGVAAVVVLGAVGALVLTKPRPGPAAPSAPAIAAPPRAEVARQAVEAALPYLGCTWLDVTSLTDSGSGLSVKLSGVAGSPAGAEAAVSKAAAGSGAKVSEVNLEEVAPVEQPVCQAIDAFRLVRGQTSATGRRLSTAQPVYQINQQSNGKRAARAVITMDVGASGLDFSLFGLEPNGKIDAVIPSRAVADQLVGSKVVESLAPGRYRLPLDTDHQGWSGLLLLTGKGPFDPGLVAAAPAARGADWPERFKAAAEAGGWKADMVWYKTTG